MLRDSFATRPTVEQMFVGKSEKLDKSLTASYEISILIAQEGKSHSVGET